MLIQDCELKLKSIEQEAKDHPEKKPILRRQWKLWSYARDYYYKKHPEERQLETV